MSRHRNETTTTRERAEARAARRRSPWFTESHCDTPAARASLARLRSTPKRKPKQ